MSKDEHDEIELVFKHSGGVELRGLTDTESDSEPDVIIWASDSDQDFMDQFGNEIMSADKDAEAVLDYLTDSDILTDEEAAEVEIYDESLDVEDLKDEKQDG